MKTVLFRIASACMLAACMTTAFAAPAPDMTLDAATRAAVIEALISKMNQHYVAPETARQVETLLRADLQAGRYAKFTSASKFADALTSTLRQTTKDLHLGVRFSPDSLPADLQAYEHDKAADDELARRVVFNSGVAQVQRMAGNIGYLKVDFFPPARHMEDVYAAAMTLLRGTEALIIDLRDNQGGEPTGVALLESYFFDKPTLMNTMYKRATNSTREFWTSAQVKGPRYNSANPVYILTNKGTFSAGEDFAYSMQAQKRATLVGATTGGGANPGRSQRLHEHFAAFISDGRAINPVTRTNWEGVGVSPDIAVEPDKALQQARILSLKSIHGRATDPRGRAELADLIEQESAAFASGK